MLFIEARLKKKVPKGIIKRIQDLPYKKIGLLYTVNFINQAIQIIKEVKGKKFLLGKGKLTKYPGQIIGCDITAYKMIKDKVECLLFIGSGLFHLVEIGADFDKEIYIYNPLTDEFKLYDKGYSKKYIKRLKMAKIWLNEAKNIGILVSIKKGQYNLDIAEKIYRKIQAEGKNAYIFLFDTLDFNLIEGLDIDFWINCACPRIAIDDAEKFGYRIINWYEL